MDIFPSADHDKPTFGACPTCQSRDVAIVQETPAVLYVGCRACGNVTDWAVNATPIAIRRKPSRRAGER